jgi:hypothetical protein
MADIQTEFGGSNPISLNEYYRGGSYVPNSAANAGVPTSGTIKLSDFYGATAFNYGATLPDPIICEARTFDWPSGDAWAACYFGLDDAAGKFFLIATPEAYNLSPSYENTWLTGDGTPGDYDVMFNLTAGELDTVNGSAPDTWINLGTNPVFVAYANWTNAGMYAQGYLRIRPTGGGDDLAYVNITLWAFYDA